MLRGGWMIEIEVMDLSICPPSHSRWIFRYLRSRIMARPRPAMRGESMTLISWGSLTGAAVSSMAVLAAASGPKVVELRPTKWVSRLPTGQCDIEVTFRLVVSDGPPPASDTCG
jgi:hypothetical protein